MEAGNKKGRAVGQKAPEVVAMLFVQINASVSTFQRLVNPLGPPEDTPKLGERLHKTGEHITHLVKETSQKLKQASEVNHHTQVNANKKADAKLVKNPWVAFKERNKAKRVCLNKLPFFGALKELHKAKRPGFA